MAGKGSIVSVFTDAATSPQSGIAVGAFLHLSQQRMDDYGGYGLDALSEQISDLIVYIEYESKKSTWSEIKTVIHALDALQDSHAPGCRVDLYTDCQSICDLLGKRKAKLEKSNFITRTGKILQHASLYQELFKYAAVFEIQTYKIKGHQSNALQLTPQEKIFSILDKNSRKRLRSTLVR